MWDALERIMTKSFSYSQYLIHTGMINYRLDAITSTPKILKCYEIFVHTALSQWDCLVPLNTFV